MRTFGPKLGAAPPVEPPQAAVAVQLGGHVDTGALNPDEATEPLAEAPLPGELVVPALAAPLPAPDPPEVLPALLERPDVPTPELTELPVVATAPLVGCVAPLADCPDPDVPEGCVFDPPDGCVDPLQP